jgi:hypothetical protein
MKELNPPQIVMPMTTGNLRRTSNGRQEAIDSSDCFLNF